MYKKVKLMHILMIAVMICTQFSFVGATNVAATSKQNDSQTKQTGVPGTSMQKSLQKAFDARNAQGLPAPASVSYEYTISADRSEADARTKTGAASPTSVVKIISRTTVHFDNPQQAGYEKWPDLIVQDNMPKGASGSVKPGNYNQLIYDKMQERIPGIWDRYQFGYEPRTYTFVETFTASYNEQDVKSLKKLSMSTVDSTAVEEILLGFTITGPDYDYSIDWSFDILGITVIDFWVGFAFDYGLGLRLPMEATLSTPEVVPEGSSFLPTTSITGLDWNVDDFEQAGIAPEDGNEFVMRFLFKCGIFLEVFGIDVIDYGVDIDEKESSSFETPFGPGSYFSLPDIQIPIWGVDVGVASLELGFSMEPQVGSSELTATWNATGDVTASGQITYTDPLTPVPFGPLDAVDGPSQTDLQVSDFRYYFNQFIIELSAYLYLDVFDVWDGTFEIPITDFDLSFLTDELYVGVHDGANGLVSNTTIIENVSPTADIDETGMTVIQGVKTFVGQAGVPLIFTGYSTDPGRDDLTLYWDWNDGPPSPDINTLYPVPYNVTESQTHAFQNGCLYNIKFSVMDDDGGYAEDQVPVLITTTAPNKARSEGYWQHQYKGNGKIDFSTTELECLLATVRHMSAVFDEARGLPDIKSAYNVLFMGMNGGKPIEQFDRELLVVWLNFANGAFHYDEMLDTNRDGVGDTSFSDVVSAAEQIRLNPGATAKQIRDQTRLLHLIHSMAK